MNLLNVQIQKLYCKRLEIQNNFSGNRLINYNSLTIVNNKLNLVDIICNDKKKIKTRVQIYKKKFKKKKRKTCNPSFYNQVFSNDKSSPTHNDLNIRALF